MKKIIIELQKMSNRLLLDDNQKKTQPFKNKVREIKELFKQLKDEINS